MLTRAAEGRRGRKDVWNGSFVVSVVLVFAKCKL